MTTKGRLNVSWRGKEARGWKKGQGVRQQYEVFLFVSKRTAGGWVIIWRHFNLPHSIAWEIGIREE